MPTGFVQIMSSLIHVYYVVKTQHNLTPLSSIDLWNHTIEVDQSISLFYATIFYSIYFIFLNPLEPRKRFLYDDRCIKPIRDKLIDQFEENS